jgi:hypothetical protein
VDDTHFHFGTSMPWGSKGAALAFTHLISPRQFKKGGVHYISY